MVNFRKLSAALLSGLLLLTNSAFVYAVDTNIWKERKQLADLQLAALPAPFSGPTNSFLNTNQTASQTAPLSAVLRNQLAIQQAKNQTSKFAAIVQAIPSHQGSVRSIQIPQSKNTGKTIIHIQDVHLNPEAQSNISKTIQSLSNHLPINLVAIEGAFNEIPVLPFRNAKHHPYVRSTIDELLAKNEIAGPLHGSLSLTSPDSLLVGIDDTNAYKANVDAYLNSRSFVSRTKKQISKDREEIENLKSATFNPALQTLDAKTRDYREETIQLGEYLSFLLKSPLQPSHNIEIFLEAQQLERTMDLSLVEKERAALLEGLARTINEKETQALIERSLDYRLGEMTTADFYDYLKNVARKKGQDLKKFPHLNSYIQYVLLADSIDMDKLYAEMSELEKKAYGLAAQTDIEKQLVTQSKQLYLSSKLVDFSLTPAEWKDYKSQDDKLKTFEQFYEQAHIRDEAMAKNTIAAMNKSHSALAILVTGGFHAEGIAQRLTEQGISVVSFVPRITEAPTTGSDASYLSVFAQEKSPLDQIFEGEKLFVTPQSGTRAGMTSLAMGVVQTKIKEDALNPKEARKTFMELLPWLKEGTINAIKTGRSAVVTFLTPKGQTAVLNENGIFSTGSSRLPKFAVAVTALYHFAMRWVRADDGMGGSGLLAAAWTPNDYLLYVAVPIVAIVVLYLIIYWRVQKNKKEMDPATPVEEKKTPANTPTSIPSAPIQLGNPLNIQDLSSSTPLKNIRQWIGMFDLVNNLSKQGFLADEGITSFLSMELEQMIRNAITDKATTVHVVTQIIDGYLEIKWEDNAPSYRTALRGAFQESKATDGWDFFENPTKGKNLITLRRALLVPTISPDKIKEPEEVIQFFNNLKTDKARKAQLDSIRISESRSMVSIPFLLGCLWLGDGDVFKNACDVIVTRGTKEDRNSLALQLMKLYVADDRHKSPEINFLIAWYLTRKTINYETLGFVRATPELTKIALSHEIAMEGLVIDEFGDKFRIKIEEKAPTGIVLRAYEVMVIPPRWWQKRPLWWQQIFGTLEIKVVEKSESPTIAIEINNQIHNGEQFAIHNLMNTEWKLSDRPEFVFTPDLPKSELFEKLFSRWVRAMPVEATITIDSSITNHIPLTSIHPIATNLGLDQITLSAQKVVYKKNRETGGTNGTGLQIEPVAAGSLQVANSPAKDHRGLHMRIRGWFEEKAHIRAFLKTGVQVNEDLTVVFADIPHVDILKFAKDHTPVTDGQIYTGIKAGYEFWQQMRLISRAVLFLDIIASLASALILNPANNYVVFISLGAILLISGLIYTDSRLMIQLHLDRFQEDEARGGRPQYDLGWVKRFETQGNLKDRDSDLAAAHQPLRPPAVMAWAPWARSEKFSPDAWARAMQTPAKFFPVARAPFSNSLPIETFPYPKKGEIRNLFRQLERHLTAPREQLDRVLKPLREKYAGIGDEELNKISGGEITDSRERLALIRLLAYAEAYAVAGYISKNKGYLIWLLEKVDNAELYRDRPDRSLSYFNGNKTKRDEFLNLVELASKAITLEIVGMAPFEALNESAEPIVAQQTDSDASQRNQSTLQSAQRTVVPAGGDSGNAPSNQINMASPDNDSGPNPSPVSVWSYLVGLLGIPFGINQGQLTLASTGAGDGLNWRTIANMARGISQSENRNAAQTQTGSMLKENLSSLAGSNHDFSQNRTDFQENQTTQMMGVGFILAAIVFFSSDVWKQAMVHTTNSLTTSTFGIYMALEAVAIVFILAYFTARAFPNSFNSPSALARQIFSSIALRLPFSPSSTNKNKEEGESAWSKDFNSLISFLSNDTLVISAIEKIQPTTTSAAEIKFPAMLKSDPVQALRTAALELLNLRKSAMAASAELPLDQLDAIIRKNRDSSFTADQAFLLVRLGQALQSAKIELNKSLDDKEVDAIAPENLLLGKYDFSLIQRTALIIRDRLVAALAADKSTGSRELVQRRIFGMLLSDNKIYESVVLKYRKAALEEKTRARKEILLRRRALKQGETNKIRPRPKNKTGEEAAAILFGVGQAVAIYSNQIGEDPQTILKQLKDEDKRNPKLEAHQQSVLSLIGIPANGTDVDMEMIQKNLALAEFRIGQLKEASTILYENLMESQPSLDKLSNLFSPRLFPLTGIILGIAAAAFELGGMRITAIALFSVSVSLFMVSEIRTLGVDDEEENRRLAIRDEVETSLFGSPTPGRYEGNSNDVELNHLADVLIQNAYKFINSAPSTEQVGIVDITAFLQKPVIVGVDQRNAVQRLSTGQLTRADMTMLLSLVQEKMVGKIEKGDLTDPEARKIIQILVRWGVDVDDFRKTIQDKDMIFAFRIETPAGQNADQEIRDRLEKDIVPLINSSKTKKVFLLANTPHFSEIDNIVKNSPKNSPLAELADRVVVIGVANQSLFTNNEGVLELDLLAIEEGLQSIAGTPIYGPTTNKVVVIPEGVTVNTSGMSLLSLLNDVGFFFLTELRYGVMLHKADLENLEELARALASGA